MLYWKKTFISIFIAQVISILGFSFAMPFLPFFIQELGIKEQSQQAWWAGLILSATGVTLTIFAPIWGVLADRYGRKLMVVRSMIGGFFVLMLMSYSRNVEELLVYRLLQGVFTGTIAASIALVASVTPSERSGFALGMMQSAVFIGVSIGPLFGGMVADHFGYRIAFRTGAVGVLLAGLLVLYGAAETLPSTSENSKGWSLDFKEIFKNSAFISAVFMLFAVRFANTVINPSFPFIVKNVIKSVEILNRVTGITMALGGVTGAIASATLGYIGDRYGYVRILIICSIGAGIAAGAHVFVKSVPQIIIAHMFFGFFVAGILPSINATIQLTSSNRNMGKAFGMASSLGMLGLALGPLAGGFLGSHFGIRSPFIMAAICQFVIAIISFCYLSGKNER